jgi:isoleucyl-tRNA synthetase
MMLASTFAFRAGRPGLRLASHSQFSTSSCRGVLPRAALASSVFPGRHPLRQLTRLKQTQAESQYKDTIILPSTKFDLRANATTTEPAIQKWWQENKIYEKLAENNPGELFVLHDGPPYANGDLHIGHAMNKILKDFINRYHILRGRKVKYVPGWDCHGLPIEMKVLQSMKQAEREGLTAITLRQKATEFAQQTIERQRASFMRYGVWGYWDKPYRTLDPEYEAKQISVFGEMVLGGHIYRGKKPVHWSPSSKTALAEAELEYPDNHVSRSIYVGFDVTSLSPELQGLGVDDSKQLRLAIWTTTPWTIPANMAVAVNANIDYCVVEHPQLAGSRLVVAKELAPKLASKLLVPEGGTVPQFQVLHTFKGKALEGTTYRHPFAGRESRVVIGGEYITTESGTGLVHTAPGHGVEDFAVGQKYGLEPLSPVDGDGKFTAAAGERFEGKSVLTDGNAEVINALQETSHLLKEEAYNHKYPYDWRTKKPTIFRATEQWFASVDRIRELALLEVDRVQWIPAVGRNRIASMLEGRSDWCISRQRAWGVPIPVFYHKETGDYLMTQETLKHIEVPSKKPLPFIPHATGRS